MVATTKTVAFFTKMSKNNKRESQMIDVALIVDNMVCEVTSARIESYEKGKMIITLSENGLENFIRSIKLQEYSEDAKKYLKDDNQ